MSLLPTYSWRSFHPNATFHYVRSLDSANALLNNISIDGPFGFDLEWKPTFTKNSPEHPVAVVQLANDHHLFIIQVSAMRQFPPKLKFILESPDIVKAGVSIQYDTKKLYRDWNVSTRNCVDLSLLARSADNARWKGRYSSPLGLARLIAAYQNLALPKGKISRSDWEASLTSRQAEYAGNDAHASYLLYQTLLAMANSLEKVPNPVYYTFDAVRGYLCNPSGAHWTCYNPDYDPDPLNATTPLIINNEE